MQKIKNDERVKEFLECLGNGKTIYQCEAENDLIDEMWEQESEGEKNDSS